ncbi:MAG: lysophospholipase [Leptospiraceae bacterium]|nr:lysophospholipase [Leptospiraceae bacterium]
MAGQDFEIIAADRTRLRGTLHAAGRPKALLIWLHGFAEHRARYAEMARWFNENKISIITMDFRGHGQSDGKRGYIDSFHDYLDDVDALFDYVAANFQRLPILLGSHSNGGLIAARYIEDRHYTIRIRGLVFTAPFMRVGVPVPAWKDKMARILGGIIPGLSVPSGIDPVLISHDANMVRGYRDDPMVFTNATTRWYLETTKHQSIALERANRIYLPTLVLQGTADKIVSPEATREFYDGISSSDKKWISYDGMFHEILNEIEREKVYKDILDWVRKYSRKLFF